MTVVINEVSTIAGGPLQEGIELFNNGTMDEAIGGWTVQMATPTIPAVTIATIPANTTLPAKAFFVVRGRNFALPTVGCSGASDFANGVALPDVLSIRLRNAVGAQQDAFGTVTFNGAFTEGSPATPQTTAASGSFTNQRVPNGTDTGDNATDFKLRPPTFCAVNPAV